MINIILFALYVLLSSSGLILFKLGTSAPQINLHILNLHISFSIKMILGIICYGASFLLWLIIVSRVELTFAMPLSVAIVNTLVVFGSKIFLNEKITLIQGIGITIVIFGVCLITGGKK